MKTGVCKISVIFAGLMFASLFLFVLTASAVIKPGAGIREGRLTLDADEAPLVQILEMISKSAGIDIFIAKDLRPGNISIQVDDRPLEEALKTILRDFSYAAVYAKDGDSWRITALKIYPEGSQSGEVTPLFAGSRPAIFSETGSKGEMKTVIVRSGREITTYGTLQDRGRLVPSQMVFNPAEGKAVPANEPWFQLQAQLEAQEAEQYQHLMVLQKRLESAEDPEMKKNLTMLYADEVAKFHAQKSANLNKIESLKRIGESRALTGR